MLQLTAICNLERMDIGVVFPVPVTPDQLVLPENIDGLYVEMKGGQDEAWLAAILAANAGEKGRVFSIKSDNDFSIIVVADDKSGGFRTRSVAKRPLKDVPAMCVSVRMKVGEFTIRCGTVQFSSDTDTEVTLVMADVRLEVDASGKSIGHILASGGSEKLKELVLQMRNLAEDTETKTQTAEQSKKTEQHKTRKIRAARSGAVATPEHQTKKSPRAVVVPPQEVDMDDFRRTVEKMAAHDARWKV